MKKELLIVFIFLIPLVFAIGSTNYNSSSSVVTSGGNASSSNYSTGMVFDNEVGSLSSSNYNSGVGFFFAEESAFCGDGTCGSSETCLSCAADCGCDSGYTCTAGTCVADEVATTTSVDSGSGGGGGGAAGVSDDFRIDENNFNLNIILGDSKTRGFNILNLQNKNFSVDITVEGLEDYITIQDSVLLNSLEEKNIQFEIACPDEIGIYTGKIILRSSKTRKEILIAINTQSKETLFDVSVTVLEQTLEKEDNLRAQITLIPVGEKGVDVSIKYLIKDFNGKVYFENSETFYVDGQMSYVKEFKVNDLDYDSYVLGVEMVYIGGFATASSQFKVVEEKFLKGVKLSNQMVFIIAIGIIILLIIIITIHRKQTYKKYARVIHKR